MKGKANICAHRTNSFLSSSGQGEHERIQVPLMVFAGPAATLNRTVSFLMNMEEAATLGFELLSTVSEDNILAQRESAMKLMKKISAILAGQQ